jgi:hypothetical protein
MRSWKSATQKLQYTELRYVESQYCPQPKIKNIQKQSYISNVAFWIITATATTEHAYRDTFAGHSTICLNIYIYFASFIHTYYHQDVFCIFL